MTDTLEDLSVLANYIQKLTGLGFELQWRPDDFIYLVGNGIDLKVMSTETSQPMYLQERFMDDVEKLQLNGCTFKIDGNTLWLHTPHGMYPVTVVERGVQLSDIQPITEAERKLNTEINLKLSKAVDAQAMRYVNHTNGRYMTLTITTNTPGWYLIKTCAKVVEGTATQEDPQYYTELVKITDPTHTLIVKAMTPLKLPNVETKCVVESLVYFEGSDGYTHIGTATSNKFGLFSHSKQVAARINRLRDASPGRPHKKRRKRITPVDDSSGSM